MQSNQPSKPAQKIQSDNNALYANPFEEGLRADPFKTKTKAETADNQSPGTMGSEAVAHEQDAKQSAPDGSPLYTAAEAPAVDSAHSILKAQNITETAPHSAPQTAATSVDTHVNAVQPAKENKYSNQSSGQVIKTAQPNLLQILAEAKKKPEANPLKELRQDLIYYSQDLNSWFHRKDIESRSVHMAMAFNVIDSKMSDQDKAKFFLALSQSIENEGSRGRRSSLSKMLKSTAMKLDPNLQIKKTVENKKTEETKDQNEKVTQIFGNIHDKLIEIFETEESENSALPIWYNTACKLQKERPAHLINKPKNQNEALSKAQYLLPKITLINIESLKTYHDSIEEIKDSSQEDIRRFRIRFNHSLLDLSSIESVAYDNFKEELFRKLSDLDTQMSKIAEKDEKILARGKSELKGNDSALPISATVLFRTNQSIEDILDELVFVDENLITILAKLDKINKQLENLGDDKSVPPSDARTKQIANLKEYLAAVAKKCSVTILVTSEHCDAVYEQLSHIEKTIKDIKKADKKLTEIHVTYTHSKTTFFGSIRSAVSSIIEFFTGAKAAPKKQEQIYFARIKATRIDEHYRQKFTKPLDQKDLKLSQAAVVQDIKSETKEQPQNLSTILQKKDFDAFITTEISQLTEDAKDDIIFEHILQRIVAKTYVADLEEKDNYKTHAYILLRRMLLKLNNNPTDAGIKKLQALILHIQKAYQNGFTNSQNFENFLKYCKNALARPKEQKEFGAEIEKAGGYYHTRALQLFGPGCLNPKSTMLYENKNMLNELFIRVFYNYSPDEIKTTGMQAEYKNISVYLLRQSLYTIQQTAADINQHIKNIESAIGNNERLTTELDAKITALEIMISNLGKIIDKIRKNAAHFPLSDFNEVLNEYETHHNSLAALHSSFLQKYKGFTTTKLEQDVAELAKINYERAIAFADQVKQDGFTTVSEKLEQAAKQVIESQFAKKKESKEPEQHSAPVPAVASAEPKEQKLPTAKSAAPQPEKMKKPVKSKPEDFKQNYDTLTEEKKKSCDDFHKHFRNIFNQLDFKSLPDNAIKPGTITRYLADNTARLLDPHFYFIDPKYFEITEQPDHTASAREQYDFGAADASKNIIADLARSMLRKKWRDQHSSQITHWLKLLRQQEPQTFLFLVNLFTKNQSEETKARISDLLAQRKTILADEMVSDGSQSEEKENVNPSPDEVFTVIYQAIGELCTNLPLFWQDWSVNGPNAQWVKESCSQLIKDFEMVKENDIYIVSGKFNPYCNLADFLNLHINSSTGIGKQFAELLKTKLKKMDIFEKVKDTQGDHLQVKETAKAQMNAKHNALMQNDTDLDKILCNILKDEGYLYKEELQKLLLDFVKKLQDKLEEKDLPLDNRKYIIHLIEVLNTILIKDLKMQMPLNQWLDIVNNIFSTIQIDKIQAILIGFRLSDTIYIDISKTDPIVFKPKNDLDKEVKQSPSSAQPKIKKQTIIEKAKAQFGFGQIEALDEDIEKQLQVLKENNEELTPETVTHHVDQVLERHKEVLALETDALELLEMFKEFKALVEQQQESIDYIESNIESALEHVKQAEKYLREAEELLIQHIEQENESRIAVVARTPVFGRIFATFLSAQYAFERFTGYGLEDRTHHIPAMPKASLIRDKKLTPQERAKHKAVAHKKKQTERDEKAHALQSEKAATQAKKDNNMRDLEKAYQKQREEKATMEERDKASIAARKQLAERAAAERAAQEADKQPKHPSSAGFKAALFNLMLLLNEPLSTIAAMFF